MSAPAIDLTQSDEDEEPVYQGDTLPSNPAKKQKVADSSQRQRRPTSKQRPTLPPIGTFSGNGGNSTAFPAFSSGSNPPGVFTENGFNESNGEPTGGWPSSSSAHRFPQPPPLFPSHPQAPLPSMSALAGGYLPQHQSNRVYLPSLSNLHPAPYPPSSDPSVSRSFSQFSHQPSLPSRYPPIDSFPPPPPSHVYQSRSSAQHAPSQSQPHLSRPAPTTEAEPIDVDSLPSPPRPPPPPAPPTAPQPLLIGVIQTTALITYPMPYLDPTVPPGMTLEKEMPKGEVLVVNGQEWGRVKMKFNKTGGGQVHAGEGEEPINIFPYLSSAIAKDPFGVVASATAKVLLPFLQKGLIRIEGWFQKDQSKFCSALHIYLLTIPPNITYVANNLSNQNLYLQHPQLPWRPQWFGTQSCLYRNPHLLGASNEYQKNGAGPSAALTNALAGRGGTHAAARVVEQQRSQVDEVFQSLKGGDDLDETDPGPLIGTPLYPHQRKAITFLRERENEKRPPTGVPKKGYVVPERGSLWKPLPYVNANGQEDGKKSSSGKVSAWEHRVTKELVKGKPKECRGAILADDMGLGKSLSIVSLIASTIGTARKFEVIPLEPPNLPSDADTSSIIDLDAAHFQGSVYGMPVSGSKVTAKQKSDNSHKKEIEAQQYARRMRITVRTRGTLIVCPLTTVSNWEDQLLEHWAGPVTVQTANSGAGDKGIKRNGRAALNAQMKKEKKEKNAFSDSDEEKDEQETLRVYVYHGNTRNMDPEFIADFDVVITTFSTLATEFSKQTRTAEGVTAGKKEEEEEDSDGIMEVDANGAPAPKLSEDKPKKRKRTKASSTQFALAKESEVTSPLQQIEWFRVVLDEAHFIKDANTVASRACCYLEAQRRICLTGTPIQNRLDDLWALLKFIRLEPFNDKPVWSTFISSPAKFGDSIGVARLQVIMRHITLRRTKETKLPSGKTLLDLPDRKDEIRYLAFSDKEQEIYQRYFNDTKEDFSTMIEEGAEGQHISNMNYVNILQKILRLRQICDHYLLIGDNAGEDEDVDGGEPLDYETAAAAIGAHGLTQRRAAAVMTWMKEGSMCECVECKGDLTSLAAGVVPAETEAETPSAPTKKGKGKKKIPQAIMTKCQHLFCLQCFKKSIYAAWPKALGGVGRSCPSCTTGLRLAVDCIEIVPPGSSEASSSSDYAATKTPKKKSRPRRHLENRSELVMSTKISFLMSDLLSFSALNPYSSNYAGGNPRVSNSAFVQPLEDKLPEPAPGMLMEDEEEEEEPTGVEEMVSVAPSILSSAVKPEFGLTELPESGLTELPDPAALKDSSCPGPSSTDPVYSIKPADVAAPSLPESIPQNGLPSIPTEPASSSQATHPAPNAPPPAPIPVEEADETEETKEEARMKAVFAADLASGNPIKTIVFSQWTSMLDRIEDALVDSGIKYDRLDGTMKRDDRTLAMERLKSDPACEVLLVSLRAGGVGLNLTAANRCYLMDPYWNPAVENQAVDRIHRLGQTRPVLAVKYIIQDTLEDKMLTIQRRKRELANLSLSQTITKKELHERRMEELKTLFA